MYSMHFHLINTHALESVLMKKKTQKQTNKQFTMFNTEHYFPAMLFHCTLSILGSDWSEGCYLPTAS